MQQCHFKCHRRGSENYVVAGEHSPYTITGQWR